MRSRYVARTPPLEARSPGRCSNVENAPVDGQSPATKPRNFENAPRHPPVSGQQRAQTPSSVRTMWSYRGMHASLLLGFTLCCHSNATRAPIANLPNSAQPGGIPYHYPKLHPGSCSSVGMRPQTDRHTHTDTQTRVTTIHFASSTTHAKCNNI